ncbi:putative ABC transport system ATP-binding protein [Hydrogenoanaerobacterium saccharovorans]|uniref:Putative ABC transport system ATP-binding protein n=2 Tax=Hydrogenoanaerobacterium saccharovorans TaxID=474960 RepID=A0A1H8AP43_9FIRM|nr:putative ABC transport system ATP-binding protein [Hydrogenoanaerobacterium saccharovorans]SEM71744.1 putative ABC transport system ATP-binding protein [Hydrogenoanaerobacterium saccharovorans]
MSIINSTNDAQIAGLSANHKIEEGLPLKKAMITVNNLRKVYKLGSEKVIALDNINITIGEGEICCILGTSGSGKSTLLNMLAGLEKPTRGQVLIGKHDIARMDETALAKFRQKYVGFVFQSYNLLSALTALENVSMPLMFRGVSKGKRNKAAKHMLKNVGLGNRYEHKPSQMSGGQQQRVGIARAFVSKPRIVFADEPTGNLDTKTTIEVMELMVQMSRENNQTLIIVTHDPEIAEYADRILTLIDGKVVSDVYNDSIAFKGVHAARAAAAEEATAEELAAKNAAQAAAQEEKE